MCIPEKWGAIQNDRFDDKVKVFDILTLESLERAIANLEEKEKEYVRRRWYITQCTRCDEYLFCLNPDVEQNPLKFDKNWDLWFKGKIPVRFDLKCSVIPSAIRVDAVSVLADPQKLVESFYSNQGREGRYAFQNRLFVVHHSFVDFGRERQLRCAWRFKARVYEEYTRLVLEGDKKFLHFGSCVSDVIVILEKAEGELESIIY